MPKDNPKIATIFVKKELQKDIKELGNRLGIYGERNVVRTLRHLIRLAESRPDFFHVLNKNRKFPKQEDKYASL